MFFLLLLCDTHSQKDSSRGGEKGGDLGGRQNHQLTFFFEECENDQGTSNAITVSLTRPLHPLPLAGGGGGHPSPGTGKQKIRLWSSWLRIRGGIGVRERRILSLPGWGGGPELVEKICDLQRDGTSRRDSLHPPTLRRLPQVLGLVGADIQGAKKAGNCLPLGLDGKLMGGGRGTPIKEVCKKPLMSRVIYKGLRLALGGSKVRSATITRQTS